MNYEEAIKLAREILEKDDRESLFTKSEETSCMEMDIMSDIADELVKAFEFGVKWDNYNKEQKLYA